MTGRPLLIAAVAVFFTALAAIPLVLGIQRGMFAGMGLHGWIALGLGCVFSIIVGVGLMTLVFHSSRKGFDDRAGDGL